LYFKSLPPYRGNQMIMGFHNGQINIGLNLSI
jgi:hypothetical protein